MIRFFNHFPTIFWKGAASIILILGVGISGLFPLVLSAKERISSSPLIKKWGIGEYPTFVPHGAIRRFLGETLYFDISFLWFDNAAEATVGLYEQDGRLYSILEARTKGFVGFFTAYRKHIYKATFDLVDNGKRVRSKKFEREVIEGDRLEQTQNYFDYHNRLNWWFKYIDGEMVEKGQRKIPEGVNFDDILAAFYNLRNSVYGPFTKGAQFTINTIPEKGVNTISVDIKKNEDAETLLSEGEKRNGEDLLLRVVIPKEIFKTENGELFFWSSKHYIPLETTVKDYILLGDLHAKFKKRDFKSSLHGGFLGILSNP